MKTKKKKSIIHSRFYQVYFAVVLLILIGMAVGRIWLGGVLRDYEAAQPVHAAEEVAKLFEDGDYQTIYRMDTAAQDISGGDEAFYLESMQALANGRTVAWSDAFSSNEDERRYNVTLDGEKFATFTLVPSGQTTGHGNRLWQLGSITTLVQVEPTPEETPEPEVEATPEPAAPAIFQCSIEAPTGYTVTVDGVTLTAENAETTLKSVVPEGFLPKEVTGLTNTVYTYAATGDAPQVTVTDAAGVAQQVNQTDPNRWVCPMPGDQTFQQQYSDAVFALAKRIASVTARDASVNSVLKKCARNSPAWAIFDNYSNRWATPHSGSEFRNPVVSEFYIHSQDCFTCHITFDFVLKTNKGEQSYPTAYTFCIIKQGGAKLYNLMMQ